MYDPKYSSVSKSTQTILAKLVNTDKPAFSVRMASVLKQSGSSDCGLFAIAYVTHIANRLDPFSILKERRSSNLSKVISIKVYCYCHSTYNGEKMVECSEVCGEWYHIKCVTTTIYRNKNWLCTIHT